MKKLNEDIVISDPQMAQQYANGQTQLINYDKQINALQMQINKIEQNKVQISKKMAELEQKAAQNSGQEKSPDQQQGDQAAVAAQAAAAAQAAQVAANESLLERIDPAMDEEDRINLEIDQLADQIVYYQEHYDGDPGTKEEVIDDLMTDMAELQDRLSELERDQMDHEDLYDPQERWDLDQNLDLGEHPLDEAEDEEPRFTGMHGFPYEVNKEGRPIKKIDPVRSPRERKQRPWSDAKHDKYDQFDKDIRDIGYEIEGLEEEMKYNMERFQAPNYEGIEGEIEEFFGQIGFEASDVLNSGMSDKEKIKGLKKLGVEDPKDLLNNYHHYFPEYDSSLDKQRKEIEKENKQIQSKIDKLKAKIAKKEEQQDKMGYPVYDSYNPMTPENFYNLDEAYIEMEDEEEKKESKEDYLDEDYVFYVKVNDDNNEFIGKIFKISPDGDWFGLVKKGDDDSFEKISYEPEYDEIDIVEFLGDSYDSIEIIDNHEFNDYIEDNEEIEESWPMNTIASS